MSSEPMTRKNFFFSFKYNIKKLLLCIVFLMVYSMCLFKYTLSNNDNASCKYVNVKLKTK